ncbi:MAG: hypothetical protein AB7N76_34890 [Planctomycetota bacterium]
MFALRWLPGLLLALALPAAAQPVTVKLGGDTVEEGRPAHVRFEFVNTGSRPLLLLGVEARVAQAGAGEVKAARDWTLPLKGVSLDPIEHEVVTLTFSAHDDPGPAARMPLPPVVAGLEGEPYRRVSVLQPGRKVELDVPLVPRAAPVALEAKWRAIPYLPGMPLFAIQDVETWSPGAARAGDPAGEERAGTFGGVGLSVELTRWRRWTGTAAGELLVSQRDLAKLGAYEGSARPRLVVKPAAFGRDAAIARARAAGVTDAVRLADGRWVLQSGARWWLVADAGEVASAEGHLFTAARDLAAMGRVGFDWVTVEDSPELAEELQALELAKARRTKGGRVSLSVEVTSDQLAPFLDLVARHGMRITTQGIRKK